MRLAALSREAAAAPTKVAVQRVAPREATGKIRQPEARDYFRPALGFCIGGLLILYPGYYSYRLT
jgi:hypothetical protein